MISLSTTVTNDVTMIMVEIKETPEEILGVRFHDETWQEISVHCLDHDPLPWCRERV